MIKKWATLSANSWDWFYFTDAEWVADRYWKDNYKYAVYLDIKNPLIVEWKNKMSKETESVLREFSELMAKKHKADIDKSFWWYNIFDKNSIWLQEWAQITSNVVNKWGDEFTKFLKEKWYDGIKESTHDWFNKWEKYNYIAFEPNQIKSATDNIWTFDKNNPDIRYKKWLEKKESWLEKNDGIRYKKLSDWRDKAINKLWTTMSEEYLIDTVNELAEYLDSNWMDVWNFDGDIIEDVLNYTTKANWQIPKQINWLLVNPNMEKVVKDTIYWYKHDILREIKRWIESWEIDADVEWFNHKLIDKNTWKSQVVPTIKITYWNKTWWYHVPHSVRSAKDFNYPPRRIRKWTPRWVKVY
jgi:hypothetical protein